jgi:hypothetical protein
MQHLHICISVQKTDDRQRVKYTRCAWAGGTESQFVVERKFIRELYNTSLKFNVRTKIS